MEFRAAGFADRHGINGHGVAFDGRPAHWLAAQRVGQLGFLEQSALGREYVDVLFFLERNEVFFHFTAFHIVTDPRTVGAAYDGDPLDRETAVFEGLNGDVEVALFGDIFDNAFGILVMSGNNW